MGAKKEGLAEPTFEEALGRLQEIVRDMEDAELPLDDLISQYEKGTKLAKFCETKLAAAEKRVQTLTRGTKSEPPPEDKEDKSNLDSDEVSLF